MTEQTRTVDDTARHEADQRAGTDREPAARAVDVHRHYGTGDNLVRALDGVSVDLPAGRLHRDHGPVRLGQVDPDALPGRARHARPPGRS